MANLFKKISIGLDIADNTIELVGLEKKDKKITLAVLNRIQLGPGIVERGRIKNKEKLVLSVKQLFKKAKPGPVELGKKGLFGGWSSEFIFALPDSQVYTQTLEIYQKGKGQTDELVLKEAKKIIPLEEDDLVYSYKIIKEDGERLTILLVCASRQVVLEWQRFFNQLGIEIEEFDIEILATLRGLSQMPEGPVCLVDIGAAVTNIVVSDKRAVYYSHSINIAGNSFTNNISESLGYSLEKAEEEKIKKGVASNNSKIFPVLIKSLEPIYKEIKKALTYFEDKTSRQISEVILVGGSSKLKGIIEYLSSNLDARVRLGQSVLDKVGLSTEYIGAVGLALKGVDKKWEERDPSIKLAGDELPQSKREKDKKESPRLVKDIENRGGAPEKPTALPVGQVNPSKRKNRKILLLAVVIVGILLVVLAFWYRDKNRKARESHLQSQIEENIEEQLEENENNQPEEEIIEEEMGETGEKSVTTTIVVLETETGWLRVRGGPGTNYEEITRVYPGDIYPQLEESDNWYKIKIDDEAEGWVFGSYINKNISDQ